VSFEQPVEQEPWRRFFVGVGAATLAVVTFVGVVATAVASRWRGILLAHIFFLTLWLALQVFLFAKDAYAYLRDHVPAWLSQVSHTQILPSGSTSSSNSTSSSSTSSSTSSPSTSSPKVSSYKPVTCWRDRSLDGDCFKRAEPHRKVPPPRPRIYEPCRRAYNCWSDDI